VSDSSEGGGDEEAQAGEGATAATAAARYEHGVCAVEGTGWPTNAGCCWTGAERTGGRGRGEAEWAEKSVPSSVKVVSISESVETRARLSGGDVVVVRCGGAGVTASCSSLLAYGGVLFSASVVYTGVLGDRGRAGVARGGVRRGTTVDAEQEEQEEQDGDEEEDDDDVDDDDDDGDEDGDTEEEEEDGDTEEELEYTEEELEYTEEEKEAEEAEEVDEEEEVLVRSLRSTGIGLPITGHGPVLTTDTR
jgi:hypothetical protein